MNERSAKIKQLIEDSGKSYQELETLTGVKKSSLQRYASGVTTKIPLPAIEKIASAFNVDPRYILGWEEDKKEKPTEDDGLSENARALIQFAMSVPEEKAALALRLLKSVVEDD